MADIGSVIRARERRRDLIRRLILLSLASIVIGFGTWFIGLNLWHAVALGLVVVAIGLTWILLPERQVTDWPEPPADPQDGTRRDVARLSWTLVTRRGEARDTVVTRVRALARHRLSRRQLDLDDPADAAAIQRLIGHAAYAVVSPLPSSQARSSQARSSQARSSQARSSQARSSPTSLRAVVSCLNALEALDSPDLPAAASPAAASAAAVLPAAARGIRRSKERTR